MKTIKKGVGMCMFTQYLKENLQLGLSSSIKKKNHAYIKTYNLVITCKGRKGWSGSLSSLNLLHLFYYYYYSSKRKIKLTIGWSGAKKINK